MNESTCKCPGRPEGGCQDPTPELHSCTYSEELNDDDSDVCDCCVNCQHECCMDI